MKVLISWYAYQHDFKDGAVFEEGPTCQFHQHFFNHDRHIILSSQAGDDTRLELLLNLLSRRFPDRKDKLTRQYMHIDDIINVAQIKPKAEELLLSMVDDEIDIFFSPGTSAMQLTWYLCHTSLGLKTKLLQTRPPKFNKGKPELLEIKVEQSSVPVSAVLKEYSQRKPSSVEEDYKVTASLEPVYGRAAKIAHTDSVTCLILGASGTGKENLAQYIHKQSSRAGKPFVAVNCSALGDTLLESRLFGYKKGAFTGADRDTAGLFEEAAGGTLFLDEIGDISSYMQQVLLRVLQEREFIPVGDTKPRKVNVRVIAATHRSLREACKSGHFRWDLFYRLSVAELKLPTLAERGLAEKREMIQFFLKTKQKSLKKAKLLRLNAEALRVMDAYLFPGNVRELENLIESLYVFHDEEVKAGDLPEWLSSGEEAGSNFNWQYHEKALIQRALLFFKGNKRKTCEALGYGSSNTLQKKLQEYQIG